MSLWETMADARQMESFAPMLAQRPVVEAAGVEFDPITNHEVQWSVTH